MTAWKATERKVAALLGGQRVPVTGRARGDAPDIAHPDWSVEVKHRQALPSWLHAAMRQADAARQQQQRSIVVLHAAGDRFTDALVVMKLSDFIGMTPRGSEEIHDEH
jgi:uncharacterized protein YfaP (DUF2135 family)